MSNVEYIKPIVEEIDMGWKIIDIVNNSFKITSEYKILDEQYNNITINSDYTITKSWTDNNHKSITFRVTGNIPADILVLSIPKLTTNSFVYSECKVKKTIDSYKLLDDGTVYSVKISDYFYNKIEKVDNGINDEKDFTNDEITTYELSTDDEGKINISTTSKLINYLKSFIKSKINKLSSDIDEVNTSIDELDAKKLNAENYVVDNTLKSNSTNPVSNNVLFNKFNEKSNISHVHNKSDIISLNNDLSTINNNINTKANNVDLINHINNKNNPHTVTKAQLGLGNVPNLQIKVGSTTFDGLKNKSNKFHTVGVGKSGGGYCFLSINKFTDLARMGGLTAYHDGVDSNGDTNISISNVSGYDISGKIVVQYVWIKF